MTTYDHYKEDIDDYADTIQAIVGFANFFLWDGQRKQPRPDVVFSQGRRLDVPPPESAEEGTPAKTVTPDIAILLSPPYGVVAEVKKALPKDQARWEEMFKQLEEYDNHLVGWPTKTETVPGHDISLLVHTTRAADVGKYYETRKAAGSTFQRPFSIVWFGRSDEAKPYYFFRKELGVITDAAVSAALESGTAVPMDILISKYSRIKIYDAEPPLPYLMELIWTHVVIQKAKDDQHFQRLRKNQKLMVELTVDQIVEELHRGFSFQVLYDDDLRRQPKTPHKNWVVKACEQFVTMGMAKWVGTAQQGLIFTFKKYDKLQEMFIKGCIRQDDDKQIELFAPQPKLLSE